MTQYLPGKIATMILCMMLASCRHDIIIWPSHQEQVGEAGNGAMGAFYLLNEGNMGSNKCTLDSYDYATATYSHNIYSWANPTSVKELGDVGNDMQSYGSRLWVVVNASGKVEVMDLDSARRLGQVDLANPRYICFHQGYAYITSYAGPVVDPEKHIQQGMVVKVDTATLQSVDTCIVGCQPDGLAVVQGKLYVANSGGYLYPNFENTLSVIDLSTFSEIERMVVAPNLHRVLADGHGNLWVSARSDYYDQPSQLYRISNLVGEPCVERIVAPDGIPLVVSSMALRDDLLYVLGDEYSYSTFNATKNYAIVDVCTASVLTTKFIADGTDSQFQNAYSVAVHPLSGEIFITDASGYVNPGTLFCFSPQGVLKWKVRTGDIPAHIVFNLR